jgi:hypothetical protein
VLNDVQGATAEVYLHGAHVVSWKDAAGKVTAAAHTPQQLIHWQAYMRQQDGVCTVHCHIVVWFLQDLMFTSKQAIFKPPKAIRYQYPCSATHA